MVTLLHISRHRDMKSRSICWELRRNRNEVIHWIKIRADYTIRQNANPFKRLICRQLLEWFLITVLMGAISFADWAIDAMMRCEPWAQSGSHWEALSGTNTDPMPVDRCRPTHYVCKEHIFYYAISLCFHSFYCWQWPGMARRSTPETNADQHIVTGLSITADLQP